MQPRTYFKYQIVLFQIVHSQAITQHPKPLKPADTVFDHHAFTRLLFVAKFLIGGPFFPARFFVGQKELAARIDVRKALKTRIYSNS